MKQREGLLGVSVVGNRPEIRVRKAGTSRPRDVRVESPTGRNSRRRASGRPAEILILAPEYVPLLRFTNLLCENVEFDNGQVLIASRLVPSGHRLQVYGVCVRGRPENLALDLVTRRALGVILLYPWEVSDAQLRMERLADWYEQYHCAPLLVAAYSTVGNPLPAAISDGGFSLSNGAQLVGVDLRKRRSVLLAVASLLSLAAERAED